MASPKLPSLGLPPSHLAEHDPDPSSHQRGYIRGTDYSPPYTSPWSRLHPDESATLLRHLNCSYLSTHGVPPTLLSLKQHAQALCNLILALVPTPNIGEVDGAAGAGEWQYRKNDAFDFLTDLRTPYENDDPDHQLALNSLVNEVKGRSDVGGTDYHCALADGGEPRGRGEATRPYLSHHNLIMHANACLERLDHEFGTEGGLMGILPGDGEGEEGEKEAARNSLLGQWLGFTQHLVRRMHELEIAYGNALDLVAGDAVVPLQALSAAGPDGRSVGRQVAWPQDRWVLANAGDDVFGYVQKTLNAAEAVAMEKERMYKMQGVSGERVWTGREDAARGIVAVNIATRYYRLAGQGHGTVFVVPAWDCHPAVEYTKVLEKKPGVVGVPVGKFPVRVSEIEKKVGRMEEMERASGEEKKKATEIGLRALAENETMMAEMERQQTENEVLESYMGEGSWDFGREMAKMKANLKDRNMALINGQVKHDEKVERLEREIRGLREQLKGTRGRARQRSRSTPRFEG